MTTKYKWLPSEPTDEMKLAMANAFIASLQIAKERYDLTDANTCATILGFVFEQAWQAAPEVEQKPVAILGHDVPLYTHPQPKRESLTSDRISELWRDACDIIGDCDDTVTQLSCAMTFARLIEKEFNK